MEDGEFPSRPQGKQPGNDERVNIDVCRHLLCRENGAVHVDGLGLIYRPAVLNFRVE
jgi:hypothetical protein